jgi:homoisocitrate dehydrogenase
MSALPMLRTNVLLHLASAFSSAAMLLTHLGHHAPAKRINDAVDAVLREGQVLTPDLGGKSSTAEVTEAILKRI